MQISNALQADLEAILALQRSAFESEARIAGNFDIPPLRQTLQELEQEWREGLLLKAVDASGALVGSVRARMAEETAYVGKLMVHPDLQGRGIGTLLLAHMEKICSQPRLELFTSAKSLRNLEFYERAGYVRFKEEEPLPGLRLAYLEKIRTACQCLRLGEFAAPDVVA